MHNPLVSYYKCPPRISQFITSEVDQSAFGYFHFGRTVCYGTHPLSRHNGPELYDAIVETEIQAGIPCLTFDPAEVIDNLRTEKYMDGAANNGHVLTSAIASMYYLIRPLLPLSIRKHILRAHLRGWDRIAFPRWPVDTSVDELMSQLLRVCLSSQRADSTPFIWFWPKGVDSCAIMTHDVETEAGRDYCDTVMDIDESFDIRSSFQVVPEKRYAVPCDYLSRIRDRGFEIDVQDLNHDGRLFADRQEFLRRVAKINSYGEQFGASGFRSAILFRRQEWFDALDFQYDMSVPNAGHLDPQRGGCCTVMPYFVGGLLELPVTTSQDYSLFNILKDHSIDLWKQQIELIRERHGLISFIIHPDYIIGNREAQTYKDLLTYLTELRAKENLWIATAFEVNRWWRQRAEMTLVEDASGWRIEGPGSERACIAYASCRHDRLEINVDTASLGSTALKEFCTL